MDFRENKLQRADRENYILTVSITINSFNNSLILNLILNMFFLLKHFKGRHFVERDKGHPEVTTD